MPTNLDQLQPAERPAVAIYMPFCQNNRHAQALLPRAISLYRLGNLEGERKIEGGDPVHFVATWTVSGIALAPTRCQVVFDANADLTYAISMQNHELINYLMEVIVSHKRHHIVDFSKSFYIKLLRLND